MCVVGVISQIYEDKSAHPNLYDENFVSFKDLFWSIGCHFVCKNIDERIFGNLVELLEMICPENDWKSIPGLSERVGKGQRGDYFNFY